MTAINGTRYIVRHLFTATLPSTAMFLDYTRSNPFLQSRKAVGGVSICVTKREGVSSLEINPKGGIHPRGISVPHAGMIALSEQWSRRELELSRTLQCLQIDTAIAMCLLVTRFTSRMRLSHKTTLSDICPGSHRVPGGFWSSSTETVYTARHGQSR